jgi:hypothetical protein
MITLLNLAPIFAIPAIVWLVSYLLLAREFRTWNLLAVRIHESGKYTLAETVLYYDHFLRELPIDTLLACAILWSYSVAGFLVRENVSDARIPRLFLGIFLIIVFYGSVASIGLRSTLADLIQARETDTRLGWGTHWQMHFLSTAILLILLMLPGMTMANTFALEVQALVLIAAFLGLSIVFRCGYSAILHPRWILHGAREVFTYFLIIALPAFLPLLETHMFGKSRLTAVSLVALGLLACSALYFLYVFQTHNLDEEASSKRGIVYLLSSHFFEHALDFIYILLFILAIGS